MGSARVMKGRPVPNALLDQKLNMTNKLRPKFTVAQIQANAEIRRIRVAPKETVLHPRMQNLMFDFRVHRGSPHPKRWMEPEEEPPKLKPPKVMISHAPTPEPPIQLESYLEALPKPDHEDPDPDPYFERAPTPVFVPWPLGPVKETQIWPGDLFEFDSDVEPMLEVLVGRCLAQGYMDAQEELQVNYMRNHQESFEFLKIAELDCWQRMRLAEIRCEEERERRCIQEAELAKEEALLGSKVEALKVGRLYLTNMMSTAIQICMDKGLFEDPLEKQIKEVYLPHLYAEMAVEYDQLVQSRKTVNLLVDETVEPPDYLERAEDGMNIVMAQLLNILDSWITFEDDVMIELDAVESASQFTMQGIVGEVHLVESASQFTMQGIVGEVGLVTDTSNLLMDSVLETVDTQAMETTTLTRGLMEHMMGQLQ
ncbi:unnamed protein product [Sphagnum compactum]